jgi:hypothetical protein
VSEESGRIGREIGVGEWNGRVIPLRQPVGPTDSALFTLPKVTTCSQLFRYRRSIRSEHDGIPRNTVDFAHVDNERLAARTKLTMRSIRNVR